MNKNEFITNLYNHLSSLNINTKVGEWTFAGLTETAYGTPGGSWDSKEFKGYKFDRGNKSFILRAINTKSGESIIVIEAMHISTQLINYRLTSQNFKEDNGVISINENFVMTVRNRVKYDVAKLALYKAGLNEDNVIVKFSSKAQNYNVIITELIKWAEIRETAKDLIRKQKETKAGSAEVKLTDEKKEATVGSKESPVVELGIKIPLNLILYGPPGTGKTYHTVNKSLEIVLSEELGDSYFKETDDTKKYNMLLKKCEVYKKKEDEGRDILTSAFKHFLDTKQIIFTTFHQSMCYEDFVEGIKPLKSKDNKPIEYDIEDGIFKKVCKKALEKRDSNFDEIIDNLKNQLLNTRISLKTSKHKKDFEVSYEEGSACFYVYPKDTIGDIHHSVNIEKIKEKYIDPQLKNFVTNESYVVPIISYMYEKLGLKKYQDMKNIKENYVIVIDEINRGNVSSIFGELITLIEKDKRIGENEELRVVLPYSKDYENKFGVPSNLYIIGTMNTADRSVEALDTALRRRFSFEEMPPKPEILTDNVKLDKDEKSFKVQDLIDILNVINERIEILLDRDHLIGHSYFMCVKNTKDLKEVFAEKIIPLLQEYFFGDYGKISLVLGEKFCKGVKVKEISKKFAKLSEDYDVSSYEEKIIYKIENPMISGFDIKTAIEVLLNKKEKQKVE
jgi:MoxR-like ATPase